jgi:large subunit ribosomal protein L4
MTGGGIVHGPTPRSYAQRTPKKMIAAALLGALSDRARGRRIHAVTAFAADAPSTSAAVTLIRSVVPGRNVLAVCARGEENAIKSVRNIPHVHALFADQLNAYDVLVSDDIIFTTGALAAFVDSKKKQEVSA